LIAFLLAIFSRQWMPLVFFHGVGGCGLFNADHQHIDAYFYSPPPKFLLINFSYNSISLSGMRLVALPGKRATGAHSLDLLIKYQLYELKCALPLF
jgi:hypothetical protein